MSEGSRNQNKFSGEYNGKINAKSTGVGVLRWFENGLIHARATNWRRAVMAIMISAGFR